VPDLHGAVQEPLAKSRHVRRCMGSVVTAETDLEAVKRLVVAAPAVFQVAEGLAASCTRVVQNHPPRRTPTEPQRVRRWDRGTEMKVLAGGKRSGG
jgi:hypothetical protein